MLTHSSLLWIFQLSCLQYYSHVWCFFIYFFRSFGRRESWHQSYQLTFVKYSSEISSIGKWNLVFPFQTPIEKHFVYVIFWKSNLYKCPLQFQNQCVSFPVLFFLGHRDFYYEYQHPLTSKSTGLNVIDLAQVLHVVTA